MRRVLFLGVVITLAGLVLAACGGGHSGDTSGMDHGTATGHEANAPVASGARGIAVSATSFEFTPTNITMKSGEAVTISLSSDDGFHDLVVEGKGHVVGAKKGETTEGGLQITKPGTYKFWCTVVGHRAQGMKGTITVT